MSGELQPAGPGPDGEDAIGGTDLTLAASGERARDALDGSASHPSGGSGHARDAVPATLGRFKIERTLGSGGMGVVYLAEDPSLGRKVAIKLLHADRAQHEQSKARLQREARALASLSHPNVVVVHEVGVHDHQVYLVMEHVAGQTLREWTRAHAGDWAAIVAQYRAAGEGLAAAHRAGIIHRDFKPDNVIVDEDGRPHVLDFGLASPGVVQDSVNGSWEDLTAVDLTKTGTILGTPAYMAPEQFLGADLDARSDQFSLCVALWEALFDRRPFGGDDLVELRSRVLGGKRSDPPVRTRVPRWISDALARGLAVAPDQRFASMPELLRALADPRPSRRRRVSMGVALGVLGVVILTVPLLRPPEPADASPSSPAPEVVAEEPSPAVSVEPAAERPSVSIWPLTRTSGSGVVNATTAVGGDMVYCVNRGESGELPDWWRLSASSADPRLVDLPLPHRSVVHQGPDGTWWIVDNDAIRGVRPGGALGQVFERQHDGVMKDDSSWLAPDGRSLALAHGTGFEIWDLDGARAEPVRVELGAALLGLGWSPDSRRIAASTTTAIQGTYRIDVFDADGSLQSSTPWPESAAGMPLMGLAWMPEGLVTLVFDGQVWVQCMALTESGLRLERRSASLPLSRHTRIIGLRAEHTLALLSPEEQAHVLVLERIADGARPVGPTPAVRAGKSAPLWLSDTELAYLAAEPPGALVRLDLDDPARLAVLAEGPFEWAASDGAGGLVLGSTGDPPIQHRPKGAASPRALRLSGVGALDPHLRCREPHDCLMMVSRDGDDAFFEVDLERDRVRRSFQCPSDVECRGGRWSRSHDGEQILVIDAKRRELVRLDARSGARIGETRRASPWAELQSVAETPRGELLVTGILSGEPPWGSPSDIYLLMRFDDEGSLGRLWSDESTWILRPRGSPSGRYIALESIVFHSELVALGLGALCDSPAPGGPAGPAARR